MKVPHADGDRFYRSSELSYVEVDFASVVTIVVLIEHAAASDRDFIMKYDRQCHFLGISMMQTVSWFGGGFMTREMQSIHRTAHVNLLYGTRLAE